MKKTLEELEKEHAEAYYEMLKQMEDDPNCRPIILYGENILGDGVGYSTRRVFLGKRLVYSETN